MIPHRGVSAIDARSLAGWRARKRRRIGRDQAGARGACSTGARTVPAERGAITVDTSQVVPPLRLRSLVPIAGNSVTIADSAAATVARSADYAGTSMFRVTDSHYVVMDAAT